MTPPRTATSPRRPAPAPERPRHLEVVQPVPVRGRRPPTVFVVLAIVVTGAALFSLVMANVMLGQAGFSQADLEHRVEAKRLEVEQARIDVEQLRSPARVYTRALEIGMVPAADMVVLKAKSSTSTSTSTRSGPSPVRGRRP